MRPRAAPGACAPPLNDAHPHALAARPPKPVVRHPGGSRPPSAPLTTRPTHHHRASQRRRHRRYLAAAAADAVAAPLLTTTFAATGVSAPPPAACSVDAQLSIWAEDEDKSDIVWMTSSGFLEPTTLLRAEVAEGAITTTKLKSLKGECVIGRCVVCA